MSKSAKKWLVAAGFLVLIGAILFAAVMMAYHWDFSRLGTDRFETNTYGISEAFTDVKLNTETADVIFAASDDGTCRVVCYEAENEKHAVYVQDGTLTVSVTDDRAWYERIGFRFQSPKVTVYLPEAEYASIVMEASTGDVQIANGIRADRVVVSLHTGEIRINHLSAGTLELSASTGDIFVSDVTCTGDVKVGATTGDVCVTNVTCRNFSSAGSTSDISLRNVVAAEKITVERSTGDVCVTNVTCRNFSSAGSTGDISLRNVVAAEKITVERSTGDVAFDGSDAAEIFVKTSTGDVTGSLLTEKVFVTETSTGHVSVPGTASGGKCEIITSTGDIVLH